MSGRTRLLFFSRGRGRGHAIPDIALAESMLAERSELEIRFVSYGTGAATLRERGWKVADLNLPENNPYLATLIGAMEQIGIFSPSIVIAHEEFAAVVASRLSRCRSIFISAWLPSDGSYAAESLQYADSTIIFEESGIFPVPAGLKRAPIFVGPLLRKLTYTAADRRRARVELRIPVAATVVLVLPGSFVKEDDSPISDAVVGALRKLGRRAFLVWVADSDYALVRRKTASLERKLVIRATSVIEQLLAASDVVITKGTRGASLDAAVVGVPTISLSPRVNPVDELLVPRMMNNTSLTAAAVDDEVLFREIERALRRSMRLRAASLRPIGANPREMSHVLLTEINRLLGASPAAGKKTGDFRW
jgi:hypothetical protein